MSDLQIHIRQGVTEILEAVSEFCNIYVYSHGMKSYIMEVLKVLDPEEKYIKERDKRVLAPTDEAMQLEFAKGGKSIKDFVNENLQGTDWLIIDD